MTVGMYKLCRAGNDEEEKKYALNTKNDLTSVQQCIIIIDDRYM